MWPWSKNNKEITVLDAIIETLNSQIKEEKNAAYCEELKKFVVKVREGEFNPFHNDELLAEVVYCLTKKTSGNVETDIAEAFTLYNSILIEYRDEEQARDIFINMFNSSIQNGLICKDIKSLSALFTNKNDYVEIMDIIINNQDLFARREEIYAYIIRVRKYYTNPSSFKADVIDFMTNCLAAYNGLELDQLIERRIEEARQKAGVVTISEELIASLNDTVSKAQKAGRALDRKIAKADEAVQSLTLGQKKFEDEIQASLTESTTALRESTTRAISQFTTAYQEAFNRERNSLTAEKDQAIQAVWNEFEKKRAAFDAVAVACSENTTTELKRIIEAGRSVTEQMQNFMTNEAIRQMTVDPKTMANLLQEISQVKELANRTTEGAIQPRANISCTTLIKETPDAPVNHFFDERIPFESRLSEVREQMKKKAEEGEIFHEVIEDALTFIIEGAFPYFVGPSGCGKSYMLKQIADLLKIDHYNLGRISSEWQITGTKTPDGGYSPTNLYYGFVNGCLCIFDELDSGNPNASIVLNEFADCSKYDFFPGITRYRHPNFRIMAAGNTDGSGPSIQYSTRSRIDEALRQRMIAIPVAYDNAIEYRYLKKYPDWYRFMIAFRKATDEYSVNDFEIGTGFFTTRDAKFIEKFLNDNCFGKDAVEKIVRYMFLQTKSKTYREHIADSLKEYDLAHPNDCSEQCKTFIKLAHS